MYLPIRVRRASFEILRMQLHPQRSNRSNNPPSPVHTRPGGLSCSSPSSRNIGIRSSRNIGIRREHELKN